MHPKEKNNHFGVQSAKNNLTKNIKNIEKNQIYFDIYRKTAEFYQKQLFEPIGEEALTYITSRGVKEEIIKHKRSRTFGKKIRSIKSRHGGRK